MFNLFRKKTAEPPVPLYIDTLTVQQFNGLMLSLTADIEAITDDKKIQELFAKVSFKPEMGSIEQVWGAVGLKRFTGLIEHLLKTKTANVLNILAALTGKDRNGYENQLMLDTLKEIKELQKSEMSAEILSFFTSRRG